MNCSPQINYLVLLRQNGKSLPQLHFTLRIRGVRLRTLHCDCCYTSALDILLSSALQTPSMRAFLTKDS